MFSPRVDSSIVLNMKEKINSLALALGVPLLIILVLTYVLRASMSPPYAYAQSQVVPLVSTLCVGDTLLADLGLNIIKYPVVSTSYLTIWSKSENRTVINAEKMTELTHGMYGIRTQIWTGAVHIQHTLKLKIPKLAPGDYEVRGAMSSSFREVEAFTIDFTIAPFCDTEPS